MPAAGTQELPDHITMEAEPVLLAAARRLDPSLLRRLLGHLQQVADPEGADDRSQRRHARRGLWLAPTFEGMVAIDGLLEPEAGQTLLTALEPLARPADAQDQRSGPQRNADALTELTRRQLEGGRLPQAGGPHPTSTMPRPARNKSLAGTIPASFPMGMSMGIFRVRERAQARRARAALSGRRVAGG